MKGKPIASEQALKELALNYVARFPCTTEKLRRYLAGKLRDATKLAEAAGEPRPHFGWIDGVVATLTRVRLLDDGVYAELRARTLHLRGRGQRFIARDLEHRQAESHAIDHALEALSEEVPDADLVAAIRLAKKRRLGPFAPAETRRDHRQRHLATLARSGFSFAIARQVVDAPDEAALDELLDAAARAR